MQQQLDDKIRAINQWKQAVGREMARFRLWVRQAKLADTEFSNRIADTLDRLQQDRMLIAFVGEFSRGKSELINALLCQHYKRRLLPSRAGRATMCPTEIFFDPQATGGYVKLLPIETRMDSKPLSEYRNEPEHWMHLTINLDEPSAMSAAFAEVARTRPVSTDIAADMGFDVRFLEPALEKPGMVLIPAWRHALIHIDHPALRQGLAIIDTPGLNALGSEPELTLSLLPEAHALVFVLGADTLITASDYDIWNEHIEAIAEQRPGSVYAVLNKIDSLIDDDESDPRQLLQLTQRLRAVAATQLKLPLEQVLAVSARQGVRGRLNADDGMLMQSHMPDLESALARTLVGAREQHLKTAVLRDVFDMLASAEKIVRSQLDMLQAERGTVSEKVGSSEYEIMMVQKHLQQEQHLFNRCGALLQQARACYDALQAKLTIAINKEKLTRYFNEARASATRNPLGLGSGQTLQTFFNHIRGDLQQLETLANNYASQLSTLYQQHAIDTRTPPTTLRAFTVTDRLLQLTELEKQTVPLRNRLSSLLSGQDRSFDRMLLGIANQAATVIAAARQDIDRWTKEVLGPLAQDTVLRKQKLQGLMNQLKQMNDHEDGNDAVLSELDLRRETLEQGIHYLTSVRQGLQQYVNQ